MNDIHSLCPYRLRVPFTDKCCTSNMCSLYVILEASWYFDCLSQNTIWWQLFCYGWHSGKSVTLETSQKECTETVGTINTRDVHSYCRNTVIAAYIICDGDVVAV